MKNNKYLSGDKSKTPKDYLKAVPIIPSNLQYIADSGAINGSLLASLENVMREYANQKIKEAREYFHLEAPGSIGLKLIEVEKENASLKEQINELTDGEDVLFREVDNIKSDKNKMVKDILFIIKTRQPEFAVKRIKQLLEDNK